MHKRETPHQHDRVKIRMDLCQIEDRTLLVVTDYYSNFLSVEKLKKKLQRDHYNFTQNVRNTWDTPGNCK